MALQEEFVESLGSFLGREHPDCCFYIYGSVYRGDHTADSDVDGGIILDSGVVTDKRKLYSIAHGMAHTLAAHPVITQISVMDRQSAADGRFISYGPDFTDHIKEASRIVSGPDFRYNLNGIDFRTDVLRSAAFNLRNDRNYAALLLDLVERDPERAHARVLAALDHAIKYPKHLVWLQRRVLLTDHEARKKGMEDLLGIRGECLDALQQRKARLREGQVPPEDYFAYHTEALELTERLIEAYLTRFPMPCTKERLVPQ